MYGLKTRDGSRVTQLTEMFGWTLEQIFHTVHEGTVYSEGLRFDYHPGAFDEEDGTYVGGWFPGQSFVATDDSIAQAQKDALDQAGAALHQWRESNGIHRYMMKLDYGNQGYISGSSFYQFRKGEVVVIVGFDDQSEEVEYWLVADESERRVEDGEASLPLWSSKSMARQGDGERFGLNRRWVLGSLVEILSD